MVTKTNLEEDTIEFAIYGGSQNTPAAITATTPIKGDVCVPFDCEVWKWRVVADQSGSIVVDIWMDTYAAFLAGTLADADSITGTDTPTLSSVVSNESTALTGWTRHLIKGRTLRYNVDSVATVQRAVITLFVKRSKTL